MGTSLSGPAAVGDLISCWRWLSSVEELASPIFSRILDHLPMLYPCPSGSDGISLGLSFEHWGCQLLPVQFTSDCCCQLTAPSCSKSSLYRASCWSCWSSLALNLLAFSVHLFTSIICPGPPSLRPQLASFLSRLLYQVIYLLILCPSPSTPRHRTFALAHFSFFPSSTSSTWPTLRMQSLASSSGKQPTLPSR